MSEKVCDHHETVRRNRARRWAAALLTFVFVVALVVLIVWAILQPKKPRFTLQDATIFNLNISAANVISATVQVTVSSRNPNARIGVYYDRLSAYATYRSQQISYSTAIPNVYRARTSTCGPPAGAGLHGPLAARRAADGAVNLLVKMNGRVRWKVGSFISGRYHLHVACAAYIPVGNSKNTGIVVGNSVKYQLSQRCSVNV
ncbi:NDR1/HIN1-like protein 1 [Salvia hispanica]|uniref:NDR1/HIN1-like protein 1 n=1 Tax=Salvia hispanica TaxID=49212 RepID=UPI0020099C6A|nr:NDR1/HIN1-like protein 1 [Salvia hispanica]